MCATAEKSVTLFRVVYGANLLICDGKKGRSSLKGDCWWRQRIIFNRIGGVVSGVKLSSPWWVFWRCGKAHGDRTRYIWEAQCEGWRRCWNWSSGQELWNWGSYTPFILLPFHFHHLVRSVLIWANFIRVTTQQLVNQWLIPTVDSLLTNQLFGWWTNWLCNYCSNG